ncbi:MAG TPA: histidine kinase [Flavitalea sp.]|nr:histidine kinase [Flavitalea sp.]
MKQKALPYIVIIVFTFFISVIRYFLIPQWSLFIHILVFCGQFIFLTLVWLLIGQLSKFLDKRIPFHKQVVKRIVVQILLSLLIIAPFFAALVYFNRDQLPKYATPQFIAIIFVVFTIFVVLINFIFYQQYFFSKWQQSVIQNAELQIQTAKLEKEKTMMQFHHLKNQVNPHFLFNTLTSLDGLIRSNASLASDFVQHLSKVYRYVLEHKENEVVSVQEEVNFMDHYISLLTIRYKSALKISIDIAGDAKDKGIVMVTLQMLIDNAIKHNILQSTSPLEIRIYDGDGYLRIRNNKQIKRQIEHSSRQGLVQLQQLYAYLSDRPVLIKDETDIFEVNLPLL